MYMHVFNIVITNFLLTYDTAYHSFCMRDMRLVLFLILGLHCMFFCFCFVLTFDSKFPAFCQKHKEVGPCRTYRPYWYYDVSEHKCMTFTFGGCLGNENKFETKEQCLHVCGNGELSELNIEGSRNDIGYSKRFNLV